MIVCITTIPSNSSQCTITGQDHYSVKCILQLSSKHRQQYPWYVVDSIRFTWPFHSSPTSKPLMLLRPDFPQAFKCFSTEVVVEGFVMMMTDHHDWHNLQWIIIVNKISVFCVKNRVRFPTRFAGLLTLCKVNLYRLAQSLASY